MSAADAPQRKRGRGRGVIGRLVLLSLAFVGAWVVAANVWGWARPWWRYATIASISFTLGVAYGRFRRWEAKERRAGRAGRA